MIELQPLLIAIQHTSFYWVALIFFAGYAVVPSVMWVSTLLIADYRVPASSACTSRTANRRVPDSRDSATGTRQLCP